jgi:hypothetical protein
MLVLCCNADIYPPPLHKAKIIKLMPPAPHRSSSLSSNRQLPSTRQERVDLDFRTEVIETNNNAHSDHKNGEAAHRELLKEQTKKAISTKIILWNQSNFPRPPF